VASIVYWARAVANARSGRPQTADADIAKIETCRQQLQAAGNTYWATQTERGATGISDCVGCRSSPSCGVDWRDPGRGTHRRQADGGTDAS
jgi:hypothetical protein